MFTPNVPIPHPTGEDVLSAPPNAPTQSRAGKRPATSFLSIDTHDYNENLYKVFNAFHYCFQLLEAFAEDPERDSPQASLLEEAHESLGEELKLVLHHDDRYRDENAANAEPCVCSIAGCRKQFKKRGTLVRHLSDQHYPQVQHICLKPDCNTTMNRRDRMLNHVRSHHGDAIQYGFKDVKLACPTSCPICAQITDSWKAFYECLLLHCFPDEQSTQNGGPRTNSNGQAKKQRTGRALRTDPGEASLSQRFTAPSHHPSEITPYDLRSSQLRSLQARENQFNSESRRVERGNTIPNNVPGHMANTGGQATQDDQANRSSHPRGTASKNPYLDQQRPAEMMHRRRFTQGQSSSTNSQDLWCGNCHQVLCSLPNCPITRVLRSHCHVCQNRQPGGPLAVPTRVQNPEPPQLPFGTNPQPGVYGINPQVLNNDFMLMPTGQLMPDLAPFQFGGDMYSDFDYQDYTIGFLRQPEGPTLSEKQLAWSSNPLMSKTSKASTLADALSWTSKSTGKPSVGILSKFPMGLPTPPASPLMPSKETSKYTVSQVEVQH